jgi:hypothetical protein
MKKSLLISTLAFIAAMLVVPLTASAAPCPYSCSGNHSDNIAPADKTISGTEPFMDSYTVTVTSPACLNCDGLTALNESGGIDLTVGVVGTPTFPPGSSQAEALSLLSFDSSPLHFTDLSQDQTFDVDVNVLAATTPGDYTYSICGSGVSGYGWGVSCTNLTVTVSAPSNTDTTPPVVTYASGCPGSYGFGQSFGIEIDANDPESVVTAFDATLNGDPFGSATGLGTNSASIVVDPYNPSQIGTYALSATATSAGGTSDPAECSFTVSYNFMWLPPISLGKTSKGGSTMPIKFTISDFNGNFITDTSVEVVVKEGATTLMDAFYGTGASNVRISETDTQYIVNFQTASGAHSYNVFVYFAGVGGQVLQGTTSFSTR